jgi:hypothetical protein
VEAKWKFRITPRTDKAIPPAAIDFKTLDARVSKRIVEPLFAATLFLVLLVASGCMINRIICNDNVSIGQTQGILVHSTSFCAYPGLITLPDGNLLAAYQCNRLTVNTQLSTDQGVTWGSSSTVYSTVSPYELDAVDLALLPNGKIFLGFGLGPLPSWIGVPTYVIGTIGASDGITWSTPMSVRTPEWTAGCWGVTPVVQLANGDLLWPVWCYNNTTGSLPASSTVMLSTDGGLTWPKQITVGDGASGNDYDESAAAVYPNGEIVLIIRQSSIGPIDAYGTWWRSKSTDNGKTWSVPVQVVNNTIVGRPTLALLPCGGLVLLGRAEIASVSTTGFGTSWDEGLTFSKFTDLGFGIPGSNSLYNDEYDAMSILHDGSIAVVTAHSTSTTTNIDYRNLMQPCPSY